MESIPLWTPNYFPCVHSSSHFIYTKYYSKKFFKSDLKIFFRDFEPKTSWHLKNHNASSLKLLREYLRCLMLVGGIGAACQYRGESRDEICSHVRISSMKHVIASILTTCRKRKWEEREPKKKIEMVSNYLLFFIFIIIILGDKW